MTTKLHFKEKATRLRKTGLSYGEIRRYIPVAKSTLSLWLKGVLLSEEQKKRLYTKQIFILSKGPKSQRERRRVEVRAIIEKAHKEISLPLSLEAFRLMGAALYWAEGSKTKKFEFTNSDPFFILFMVRWTEKIFRISRKTLRARINIYSQQSETHLKRFWSDLTGIPLENFGKTFIKPANRGYKKNNLYYGTLKVLIPRGTDMRHRVFGWIEAALKNIESRVAAITKRWASLKQVKRPVNIYPP